MIDTKALREKILDLAMRGKLVPQDPNDEPASELLKRIKAEKEELIKQKKIKRDKSETEIFRGDDNLHYEKFADGMVKVIDVPYELPKGWEWVRLINITSRIHYGYTASALTEGDAKLLRITDIQKNRVNWESVPYCNISNTKLDDMQLINGDIVIARTGGTLGKSFHIMDLTDVAVFASYLIRLQSVDIKNSFFNKRFLESFEYWKQLDKISGGTGQPNVNATNLGLLLIPVPPEKEQSRILNKIYNLFEDVNLIDSEQQYLTNLSEQLKQKVLDIAMQGKLVPQDPNDEPASVLLEKIRAEKQRLFEEGKLKKKDLVETEIVKGDDNAYYEKLPKGWITQNLQNVAYIQMGQSPKGLMVTSAQISGSIEFHQGKKDFGDYSLNKSNKWTTQITKIVNNPAILMSVRAPVGDVNMLLDKIVVIGRGLASIQPYISLHSYFYYLLSIKKQELESQATGTTFKAINNKILQETIIPIAPQAEQVRIVSAIEEINLQLHQLD